jgi:hypothetical protein
MNGKIGIVTLFAAVVLLGRNIKTTLGKGFYYLLEDI